MVSLIFSASTLGNNSWIDDGLMTRRYHNEHHDFPNVAWSKLPALRKLAAEYYDHLPYHESWPLVTWKFIFDDRIGVWNRVKRKKNVRMSCDGTTDEVIQLGMGLKTE
jgi:sphingolipid delta-4 desaturase